MSRLGTVLVVVWLVIGVLAATQRGYVTRRGDASCAKVSNLAVTIVAGPLNYLGVNPKIHCTTPQPSR